MTMGFDEWAQRVDALCRTHLACSWDDLAGDREPLERGFEWGQTPLEFVQWLTEKFDLIWIDEPVRRVRRP